MRARTQAPELFAFPAVISAAADVYAFAMLAWMVCTREKPYQGLQSAETVMRDMLMQATPTPPLIMSSLRAPTPTSCPLLIALSFSLLLPLSPPPFAIPTPKPSP